MDFATYLRKPGRVALILGGQTLARLTDGLVPLVGAGRDYGAISIREEPARILEQLREWQPVGVIMEFREDLTELVSGMGYPTVVVMADMLLEGMGSVNVDDYRVGQLAAEYLVEKGLRNFGFYGIESHHAPERRTGFLDALEPVSGGQETPGSVRAGRLSGGQETPGSGATGLPTHRVSTLEIEARQLENPVALHKRLTDWITSLPKPVGIFAAHDPLAREVLEACKRMELEVPSEVAILSASNDQFTCELVSPGISSVEIPWERVGRQAGELLERMLTGERSDEPVVVEPVGIRTRGSTDYYRVSDERIQRAVAFMRENLGREIGIDAVVRSVGMDRRALERLFRSQINRSPKQVLTDMRIDRARELLEQSALRIGEISERCGFGPSEKLSAPFRKRFGKTPREWRRR